MSPLADRLRSLISLEAPRLGALSEEIAAERPSDGAGWSRKQELGHLIDSATNNRVRFIKAALEGTLVGPSYDGPGWVDLGGYADMHWTDLVTLWKGLNQALAVVVDRIPLARLSAECRIANHAAVTLEFLIDDYILHMQHHLDHIRAREK